MNADTASALTTTVLALLTVVFAVLAIRYARQSAEAARQAVTPLQETVNHLERIAETSAGTVAGLQRLEAAAHTNLMLEERVRRLDRLERLLAAPQRSASNVGEVYRADVAAAKAALWALPWEALPTCHQAIDPGSPSVLDELRLAAVVEISEAMQDVVAEMKE